MVFFYRLFSALALQYFFLPTYVISHGITQYNIGALFNLNNMDGSMDLSGVQAKEAILMAIREINDKSDGLYDDLLPNITLKLATEHPGLLFSTSTIAANSLRNTFQGNGIRACIGPGSNAAIAGSATILREKGVFQIGYGGQDDAYAVKETFPSFVRLNPASGIHARVLATLIYKYFRWERVAIIHSYNVYGYYVHLKLLQSIQEMGLTNTLVFTDYGTKDYEDLILQVKKSGATIYVLLFSPVSWAVPVLKQGWKQGLFGEGTQLFAIEDLTTPLTWQYLSNSYRQKYQIADTYTEFYDFDLTNEEIASLMRGFVGLRVMINKSTPLALLFQQRWKKQRNTNYNPDSGQCNNETDDHGNYLHQQYHSPSQQYLCRGINFTNSPSDGSDLLPSAYFAYDSVLLLARSLHYFLQTTTKIINSQNQITYYDLQEILNEMKSDGVTGLYSQELSYEMRSDNERKTDLTFGVFTFDSNHFLTSTERESNVYNGMILPSSSGLFYSGSLHSSNLFQSCQNSLIVKRQCFLQGYSSSIYNCTCTPFIYDTNNGLPPSDLPPLQTKPMSSFEKVILICLSVLFFIMISFTSFLLSYYRKCRLVKITQPELSIITFIGGLCVVIGGLITSFDIQEGHCKMIDIFCHMGFILIFSPLVTKTWRLYMIISCNLKRVQITMKQTLLVVSIFVLISIILLFLVEIHRPIVDYEYQTLRDTPHERIRGKYCPAGSELYVVLLYTYEAIVIIAGGVLCYLTRNLPSGISDSSQVANAIFGIIACTILGVSLTQLTNMNYQDVLFVTVLLVLAGAIRALHVSYRSLTLKLLEGYDLDSQFQPVQVREAISFFALLSQTRTGFLIRFRKSSNQTITPTESPKSFRGGASAGAGGAGGGGAGGGVTPSTDPQGGGRNTHRDHVYSQFQNQSKVADERQNIEREIEILQHRLELLANRQLYASRFQQISEPPEDFRPHHSPKTGESSSLPNTKRLKLYNGSTVGLSASHRVIQQDLSASVDRQPHGTDSNYEEPPPLSYRSVNELPPLYPSSSSFALTSAGGGGGGVGSGGPPASSSSGSGPSTATSAPHLHHHHHALSIPLHKLQSSSLKSYAEIEKIPKKSTGGGGTTLGGGGGGGILTSTPDNDVKQQLVSFSSSYDTENNNNIPLQQPQHHNHQQQEIASKKSNRLELIPSNSWKTSEDKPVSCSEHLSDV